jgi:hypothetical protein
MSAEVETEASDDVTEIHPQPAEKVKVAYNRCYGGFSLSDAAKAMLKDRKGIPQEDYICERSMERHDPDLIAVLEALGQMADGSCADLQIKEIPADYRDFYEIAEYDGYESVCLDRKKYRLSKIREALSSTSAFDRADPEQRQVIEDVLALACASDSRSGSES